MLRSRRLLIFLAMSLLVFLGTMLIERCTPKKNDASLSATRGNKFVGDQACKSCHSSEYNQWLQSDHYMAMQPANDSTVAGDFNNTRFTADGVTSRFFRKDGKYFINTQGEDGSNHDYAVKFTFGFRPLQQYLVEFPGGRMQVPRVSWDVNNKKWFNQYTGQKIAAHDWLHWTGNSQNWNTMCASCHSTNLQKNYNIDSDNYHTTYDVINVSCESCHGAGKLHIDYTNGSDYKKGKKVVGSYLVLEKNAGQSAQLNACAPCHARKADISASLVKSNELLDNYIPAIPSTEHYHADGQANDEDYIYTSFQESKMFRHGVKCSNCHNPHSGKILYATNQLCLQCHTKTYDEPGHTFHARGTVGAECKSCHMPAKTYMGIDVRHDHIFRVPRPDLSVKFGTANACNNCHKNKPPEWAADAVVKWYGPARKYHFAEDLVRGSKLDGNSEAHLVKLLSDTSTPNIIKATSTHYLGSILTQNSLSAILKSLTSSDAQTRYRALRSLVNFPATSWLNPAGTALSDKVRAVRIAAADLYGTVPSPEVPSHFVNALAAARNELKSYLNYQADFSVGNVMLADHYLQEKDYYNAERFYLRGLKKDSLMNYARLNLSTAYNLQGKNTHAVKVLEEAAKTDPSNDRVYYNLALLHNEMNNKDAAANSFSKAIALKSKNPRVYYNYGLLLNESKKFKEAETVLMKGIAIEPTSPDLYYALTFVYLQSNDSQKAKQSGLKLKQLDPRNPDYVVLFKQLGI